MGRAQCIAAAAEILATGRDLRDSLPARRAAELAAYAGGPSVDEIERQILAARAAARQKAAA